MNCIFQKLLKGENNNDGYLHALSFRASDAIIDLLSLPRTENYPENNLLYFYLCQNLEKKFSIINKLIVVVDKYSFFLVLEEILGNVKINERDLLFDCIRILTEKFQNNIFRENSEDNHSKMFFQLFKLLFNRLK